MGYRPIIIRIYSRHNQALATGRLVPLAASSPQVVAYLRREGNHAVLRVPFPFPPSGRA